MGAEVDMIADPEAIRADLEYMTSGWDVLPRKAMLELRSFAENTPPAWEQFTPARLEAAVAWAAEQNAQGRNVYAVRNPIRFDHRGAATDDAIMAALFCWADCDDATSTDNVRKFEGPRWTAAVTTGRTPDMRVHLYWRLAEPIYDLAAWRRMQAAIAAHLQSDPVVINPSRIMRVGGTVSYPAAHKRERGYVPEICTLRTQYEDPRPPVEFERLARVFVSAASAPQSPAGGFEINLGVSAPLDRERARIQALSGSEWHASVIRLVASYVAKGLGDDEIHTLTDPLTLPAYTVDQTRREVQAAIDGARRKGWAPEPQAQPQTQIEASPPALEDLFKPWADTDVHTIPPRDFLYGNHYIRRFASVTVAPGGLGKSTLVLAECVAMATGRPILGVAPKEPYRVVYFNAEDPEDEIKRRVIALCEHHRIDQRELVGRLFIASGRDVDLILARGEAGDIVEAAFELMERFAAAFAIDVFAFDPLANMTESPETNDVFRRLGKRLSRFADVANASIELVHHTRKLNGKEAEIEDSRGGGALVGAVRAGRVLNPMTADEAVKAGLDTHIDHFRIESAGKNNLARPSDKAVWFRKHSVALDNGDHVASVEPWAWPDAFEGVTPETARRVQLRIGSMDPPAKASAQAKTWGGYVVADVLGLDADDKQDRARINQMLKTWVKSGVLAVETIHSVRDGRDVPVFVVGPNCMSREG